MKAWGEALTLGVFDVPSIPTKPSPFGLSESACNSVISTDPVDKKGRQNGLRIIVVMLQSGLTLTSPANS